MTRWAISGNRVDYDLQEAMLRHATNYVDFGKLAWPRFDLD